MGGSHAGGDRYGRLCASGRAAGRAPRSYGDQATALMGSQRHPPCCKPVSSTLLNAKAIVVDPLRGAPQQIPNLEMIPTSIYAVGILVGLLIGGRVSARALLGSDASPVIADHAVHFPGARVW